MIHYGTVGDTGETEEKKLAFYQKAKKVMDELAEEKANDGYDYLDDDDRLELVVQYSYEESEMEAMLEKRPNVEDLMNVWIGQAMVLVMVEILVVEQSTSSIML